MRNPAPIREKISDFGRPVLLAIKRATGWASWLPISFLAGFWGENSNALTGQAEKGWPAFLILSVGLNVACIAVTVFMFGRRRWN